MNIFNRFFKSAPAEVKDGIRAVKSGGVTCFELRQGGVMETRAVPEEVRVSSTLDGARSNLTVHFPSAQQSWSFDPGSEAACQRMYNDLVKGMASDRGSKGGKIWKIAAAGIGLILLALIFWPAPPAGGSAALTEPAMPSTEKTAADGGSRLSASEFNEVALMGGIATRSAGTVFQVFTDPNCPYCKEQERSFMKLDLKYNPTLLPLGFKEGSRDLSSAILCSADPAKAWRRSLLEGVAPEAKPCDKGYAQVDANMAMFKKLQLNSTPTMITPTGLLVVGSGDPVQIAAVLGSQ